MCFWRPPGAPLNSFGPTCGPLRSDAASAPGVRFSAPRNRARSQRVPVEDNAQNADIIVKALIKELGDGTAPRGPRCLPGAGQQLVARCEAPLGRYPCLRRPGRRPTGTSALSQSAPVQVLAAVLHRTASAERPGPQNRGSSDSPGAAARRRWRATGPSGRSELLGLQEPWSPQGDSPAL